MRSMLRPVLILPAFCIALSQGASPRKEGTLTHQGKEAQVYVVDGPSGPEKYLVTPDGAKVDLRKHFDAQRQENENKHGRLGPRILAKLDSLGDGEEMHVVVQFKVREQPFADGTLSREEAMRQRSDAYNKGSARLKALFGKGWKTLEPFSTEARFTGYLKKREILALKRVPEVDWVIPAAFNPPLVPTAGLSANYNAGSTGGLNMAYICSSNCGAGVQVGLIEPSVPMDIYYQGLYFYGSWFNYRPGTPSWPAGLHGVWTGGMIRNTFGPSINNWEFGGAPALSKMHYAADMVGDMAGSGAYEWAVNAGAEITNHSYVVSRERDPHGGWQMDWFLDNGVATYPYPFNVVSAGNAGKLNDGGGDNDECVRLSQAWGNPWTAEQCQRASWWGQNYLIVGSVDDATTRSPFSSFRDGETGNEAPHVVARGSNVELPWMGSYNSPAGYCVYNGASEGQLCGTSLSAPAVTAMAAGLASRFTNLKGFPEAMKGIIMASATPLVAGARWPVSTSNDWETGAGIPHGAAATTIAGNRNTGSSFSSGNNGYTTFQFPANAANGAEITRTITLPSSGSGYIQWWLVWVSPPPAANLNSLTAYYPDDLDLSVASGSSTFTSTSIFNSTEHVASSLPAANRVYTVKTKLYNRNSDANSVIRVALVWRGTSAP
jgi:hypothetical protein